MNYQAPQQDAEAIHERSEINGSLSPLATTGTIPFGLTEVATAAPGKQQWEPIGSAFAGDKLRRIFMDERAGGAIIASPSRLTGHACFTVTRGAKAPPAPPPCT